MLKSLKLSKTDNYKKIFVWKSLCLKYTEHYYCVVLW